MKAEKQSSQSSGRRFMVAAAIFSMLSMLCGTLSITESVYGNASAAAFLILIGVFFDFLDGLTAKAGNAESEFGKQLDSFSDFTVSGLAVFVLLITRFPGQYPWNLVFIAIPCAAMLRLARYNVEHDREFFRGVPTFVAGITVAALALTVNLGFETVADISLVLGVLMVSDLRIPTYTTSKKSIIVLLLIPVLAVLMLLFPMVLLSLVIAYLVIGVADVYILNGAVSRSLPGFSRR